MSKWLVASPQGTSGEPLIQDKNDTAKTIPLHPNKGKSNGFNPGYQGDGKDADMTNNHTDVSPLVNGDGNCNLTKV